MIYKIVVTVRYERSGKVFQFRDYHDESLIGDIKKEKTALEKEKKQDRERGNKSFYRITKTKRKQCPIVIVI